VSVALNLNPHQGFWLPLLAGNSWVLEVPLAPVPFHLRPDLYTKCLPFPHLSMFNDCNPKTVLFKNRWRISTNSIMGLRAVVRTGRCL
jgi:hypothetical protein